MFLLLVFKQSSVDQVETEMQIINSNPFFNRISRDKDAYSEEEVLEEILQAEKIGAKRFILMDDNQPIGIFEYLLLNPNDQHTWLGLLLINKEFHSKGYGEAALKQYNEMMKSEGIFTYRLGVVAENDPGHRFWKKHGCREISSTINEFSKRIIIYENKL